MCFNYAKAPHCFLKIMSEKTKALFVNSCCVWFFLCTLGAKWDVLPTCVEVQATLLSLFVLGCIHLLSSWSAILFVADPLRASTIQTHRAEKPWRGAWEENQHIWVWLKPSKHSPCARFFFVRVCESAYSTDTWKRIFYIFRSMCYLCFSGPWGSLSPRKMKWELAAAARRHVV